MGPSSPSRPRGKLDLLIWGLPALGLVIVAALWALVLHMLAAERGLVERDIEQRVRGLAQAFEEHTRRGLQQIDQITAFAAHQVENRSPTALRDAAAGQADMASLLKLGLADVPGVVALYVTDAEGHVLASTLPAGGHGEVADRAYFRAHQSGPQTGLFIDAPLLGRSSRQWVLPISRRLQRADGSFAGIVAVSVDPRYFTDFYRASQFGKQGMVSLMGLDMVVRARRSGERLWFGDPAGSHLAEQLQRWPEGAYVATQQLDGMRRSVAYKTLPGYPLVALAGLSVEEAMAPYAQRRTATLWLAGLASLLLLLAFGGLSLAAVNLRRGQAARERLRAQFEAASDASLDAFWILRAERDAEGEVRDFRFIHCNDRGAALLRRDKREVVGRLRDEVFGGWRDPRFFQMYCQVLQSRQPLQAEFVIDTPPAEGLWLQHQVVPVGDGVAMTSRDVTAERAHAQAMAQAQSALQATEKRLRDVTDHLPALIAYIDTQERMQFLNGTFKSWLDVTPAEALGKALREVIGETLYAQRAPWLRRALTGERVSFELDSVVQGHSRALRNEYIPDVGPGGVVQGIYTLSLDVSTLKAVERELSVLARRDSLTGLVNRHCFNEMLPLALARAARSGDALALLFLDVDKFKSINDSLGHAVGDAVLVEFAHRLLLSVRGTDTVARLAGDEFVIILEGLSGEDEPQFVARKIVAAMGRPFELTDGPNLPVTASIGIAYHQGQAITPAELLARADRALYQAKSAGRNTYRVAGI
jgi:diguanylate cyclase (GGDEF)-like protein